MKRVRPARRALHRLIQCLGAVCVSAALLVGCTSQFPPEKDEVLRVRGVVADSVSLFVLPGVTVDVRDSPEPSAFIKWHAVTGDLGGYRTLVGEVLRGFISFEKPGYRSRVFDVRDAEPTSDDHEYRLVVFLAPL
jgi:hypothetical protein